MSKSESVSLREAKNQSNIDTVASTCFARDAFFRLEELVLRDIFLAKVGISRQKSDVVVERMNEGTEVLCMQK